jgi:hypothetical protein
LGYLTSDFTYLLSPKANFMKSKILFSITVAALVNAAVAQKLTLTPQLGLENSRTSVQYNKLGSFLPAGNVLSPYLGMRADYRFKQGHGAFAGIATNRSVVSYNFSDLETGNEVFDASPSAMRVRFEAGYQFNTKRIYFNKSGSQYTKPGQDLKGEKKTCGSYMQRYSCKKSSDAGYRNFKNTGWYMSVHPSVGATVASPVKQSVMASSGMQDSYTYRAGNWNTALITGAGFEFGKGSQRFFTVSVNYLHGLGNLDTRTITSTLGNKTATASLKSAASSWNITAGIPITLVKDKKQKMIERFQSFQKSNKSHFKCGQYKPGCMRM